MTGHHVCQQRVERKNANETTKNIYKNEAREREKHEVKESPYGVKESSSSFIHLMVQSEPLNNRHQ